MKNVGIYNPYLESRGGGEKVCLALAAELSKDPDNKVFLIAHTPVDLKPLERYFNIDLTKVTVENIDTNRWYLLLLFKLPILGGFKFFISDLYVAKKLRRLSCDIFINNCYQSNLPNMGKYGIYMCMFPQKLTQKKENLSLLKATYKKSLAWLYKTFIYKSKKAGIYSYDKIVANSAYTQNYIKEYWDLDSEILYPICEDMYKPTVKKQRIILNVGRFFSFDKGSHHKRQDFLLQTFTNLKDLHEAGWQLHFAGTVANDKRAKRFVSKLENLAEGYPIYFHFNSSFDELMQLYNQSTIYWHATGYGSSQNNNPEMHEHFGISTVEAMSAGSIPIVINSAGQKEIINKEKNGYLWNDQTELEVLTRKVATMKLEKLKSVIKAAKTRATYYNQKSFSKSVTKLLSEYLNES